MDREVKIAPPTKLTIRYSSDAAYTDQVPHKSLHIDVIYDGDQNSGKVVENDTEVGRKLFTWLVSNVGANVWEGFKTEAEKKGYERDARSMRNMVCCSECSHRFKCWTER